MLHGLSTPRVLSGHSGRKNSFRHSASCGTGSTSQKARISLPQCERRKSRQPQDLSSSWLHNSKHMPFLHAASLFCLLPACWAVLATLPFAYETLPCPPTHLCHTHLTPPEGGQPLPATCPSLGIRAWTRGKRTPQAWRTREETSLRVAVPVCDMGLVAGQRSAVLQTGRTVVTLS